MSLIAFDGGRIYNTKYVIKVWKDSSDQFDLKFLLDHKKYGVIEISRLDYLKFFEYSQH